MSLAVALAMGAWLVLNVFLLMALAGTAVGLDQPAATRVWASLGVLFLILATNAVAVDSLGRYVGF